MPRAIDRQTSDHLLLGACLVWIACGCRSETPRPVGSTAKPLAVVVSCDTAGWIVPCGCSSKQAGGLLRRATFVSKVRETADVLLADAGGAAGGTSPYDRSKLEAVLRGEVAMQTAAHNIGASEAELGAEALRELASATGAPLISSNVRDAEGASVVPTHVITTVGARRVAILGVLSPRFAKGRLTVDDPGASVLSLIGTLRGQYDHLLILAYLPEEELREFIGKTPEADLVIGGPTGQSIAPQRAGPTTWGAATNKGKFLIHVERTGGADSWSGKIVELGPEIADDPRQEQNLREFREVLARADFRADQTSFVSNLPVTFPADFQVAGVAACQSCHADDCDQWHGSRHSEAWQTLVSKASHVDPYCQHCHTTGYGLPGGFASLADAAQRGNVGCESCHGPSAAHARQPRVKTSYQASDRCLGCHDHENSPQFEYGQFWSQIVHGASAPFADKE
ncbi:MAG: multiheme c-type cytochrome [Planctomycetales bacterium]